MYFFRAGVLLVQIMQNFGLFWSIFTTCRKFTRFLVYFLQALIMWQCTKTDKYQVCVQCTHWYKCYRIIHQQTLNSLLMFTWDIIITPFICLAYIFLPRGAQPLCLFIIVNFKRYFGWIQWRIRSSFSKFDVILSCYLWLGKLQMVWTPIASGT